MQELLLRRTLSGLAPVDEAGQEFLRRIPVNGTVRAKCKGLSPRNDRRLRWWWAAMGLVHRNLSDAQRERWPTTEALHEAIKVRLGHCDVTYTVGSYTAPDGTTIPPGTMIIKAGSIAFGRMNEAEFSQLCDAFCDLICAKVLPGTKTADMRREIESIVGLRKEAA